MIIGPISVISDFPKKSLRAKTWTLRVASSYKTFSFDINKTAHKTSLTEAEESCNLIKSKSKFVFFMAF